MPSNQFGLVSTRESAACGQRPERNSRVARPGRAHDLLNSRTVAHGRAHISLPDRPRRIITLGCRNVTGLSGGNILMFQIICLTAPARVLAAMTRSTTLQRSIVAVDWRSCPRHTGSGSIVDRVRQLGKSWPFISSSLARYWTSVQSIDRSRWRNVHTLAGVPDFSHQLASQLREARFPPPPGRASRLASVPDIC